MGPIGDKEFFILKKISEKSSTSQRELAKSTGVSLGLINLILKKFILTGYIQVSHLNKKKLEYLLTPGGMMETARRSYIYLTSTIQNYNHLQNGLANLLRELHHAGYDYFSIHGDGELKDLTQAVFQTTLEETSTRLGNEHLDHSRAVVLNLTAEPFASDFRGMVVNVLERLGKNA